MGCDIHSYAEKRNSDGNWEMIAGLNPFSSRSYGTFGFLADVRNYSALKPIAERRGLPSEISAGVAENYEVWDGAAHSASWLSVRELSDFDYDAICEDRRCIRGSNGGATCELGEGEQQTYREFLGHQFLDDVQELVAAGAERVVFWFDN